MGFWLSWFRSQFTKLPYPQKSFAGKTIIVTGSNVGLGLEAARHLVRLDAAKVILAVRTSSKGEQAKAAIEASVGRKGVVEVWPLDLESYDSVKAFASRAESLPRLDIVIENAGVFAFDWKMAEEDELTITVNAVSTLLLAFLLLPKLRETSVKFNQDAVLTFTGSFVHYLTEFPERAEKDIFEGLKNKETARMDDRYNVAKMIEMLLVQELASQISSSAKPKVIVNNANPGFVATTVMRGASGFFKAILTLVVSLFARTAEVGSRTSVHAAEGGVETHGSYLNDCKPGQVSDWVRSEDGKATQKKLWGELLKKLEGIAPGVTSNL
ncbi:hypothetical protein BOTCAL_0008g00140 [Botryotinia calthae]|uniref:Ketoreductase (KR) domain-containing protein n=1 Tax=Botryotinia calthae TaxID=38488 RepID=A0A4Y8DGW3_9HELO|nr:hypothetical protein BOTCAL_0008g00140 [Botryotinia calthae]